MKPVEEIRRISSRNLVGKWSAKSQKHTKERPPDLSSGDLFRAYKRGAEGQSRTDTGSPLPVFELVAVRTTRPHQPFYVPESRLQCSNAFHQTSGDIQPLDDILDDGNG